LRVGVRSQADRKLIAEAAMRDYTKHQECADKPDPGKRFEEYSSSSYSRISASVVVKSGISMMSPFSSGHRQQYSLPELALSTLHTINRDNHALRPSQDFMQYFDNEDRQDRKLAVKISSENRFFGQRAEQYLKDLVDSGKRLRLDDRVVCNTQQRGVIAFSFPFKILQNSPQDKTLLSTGVMRIPSDPETVPEIIAAHYVPSKDGALEFAVPPMSPDKARDLLAILDELKSARKLTWADETVEIHEDGLFLRCTFAHVGDERAYSDWTVKRLSDLQELVSSGVFAGAIVEFVGQFNPEILNLIQSREVGHLGICPDVELVYALPLPSGEVYNVDLKEARYFNKRRPNAHTCYSEQDRIIITGVKSYLAEKSRLNPWLFGENLMHGKVDNSSDNPYESNQMLVHAPPDSGKHSIVESMRKSFELQLEETWGRFIKLVDEKNEQGKESEIGFQTREEFKAKLLRCLDSLPQFTENLRGDDYFALSSEEIRAFLATYTDQLYDLHSRVHRHIEAERADPVIHEARVQLGYQGPENGWRLTFEYQVMDMIVDMRQKQSFREKRAVRDNIAPEDVQIPHHIGRTFENQDRFLRIDSAMSILQASKASRIIEVEVFDPEAGTTHTRVFTPMALKDHFKELDRLNLERLVRNLAEPRISNGFPYPMLSIHERVFELAHNLINQLESRLDLLESQKNEAFRRIGSAIFSDPSAKQSLIQQKKQIAEDHKRNTEAHEDRVSLIRANLVTLMRELVPHLYHRHCLNIKSIHDYHITKLIYCVCADGSVPVEEEQPGTLKRSSHSELLGGANGFGMGELVFARFDKLFLHHSDWMAFEEKVSVHYPESWALIEINNQSGHYQPQPIVLPFVQRLIVPNLIQQGIESQAVNLVDRLKPGLKIQNPLNYWGRKGIVDP
jgi:hypothetical protein